MTLVVIMMLSGRAIVPTGGLELGLRLQRIDLGVRVVESDSVRLLEFAVSCGLVGRRSPVERGREFAATSYFRWSDTAASRIDHLSARRRRLWPGFIGSDVYPLITKRDCERRTTQHEQREQTSDDDDGPIRGRLHGTSPAFKPSKVILPADSYQLLNERTVLAD